MIDLHCHILPIDDGASNLNEAMKMIEIASQNNFKKLCCTSHYKSPKYINKNYNKVFDELQKLIDKKNIDIELIKGNELYLTLENIEILKENKVNKIGNSDYLLVESIPGMIYESLKKALLEIKDMGYKPILAHVERYPYMTEERLIELKKEDIVLQVNIRSVLRKEKTFKWVEMGLIDILATDSHDLNYRSYDLVEVIRILKNRLGEEKLEILLTSNPEKILENKKVGEIIYEKKAFTFGFNWNSVINSIFKRFKP